MSLIIELSHPLGGKAIDPTGYWYGLIVHHLAQDDKTKAFVPSFHAQEIAAIGLTSAEDSRRKGGFSWPVDHWRQQSNKPEIDCKKIRQALYVGLDDVALAFPTLGNISQVNLLIGRKGGEFALKQADAVALVTLYREGRMQACPIPERIAQGQAAILSLYAGEPSLRVIDRPVWTGYPDFTAGVEGYLSALHMQDRAEKPKVKRDAALVKQVLKDGRSRTVSEVAADEETEADPAEFHSGPSPSTQHSGALTGTAAPNVNVNPPRSRLPVWGTALAAVAVLGGAGYFMWQKSETSQGVASQVAYSPPAPSAAPAKSSAQTATQPPMSRPPNNSTLLDVAPSRAPLPLPSPSPSPSPTPQTSTDTADSIAASISVPNGNSPMRREDLYKFGFDEQLGIIKQILDAAKSGDTATFDVTRDRLRTVRPAREWPKDTAVARRKFNEGMERLINVAKTTADERAMTKAIDLSEQFLMTHFGQSTAHLNLSLAQSALNRGKAALPPAIHTLVFNPDGANGWIALGVALARSNDEAGGSAAFCTALRKVNFSDKTVAFLGRISRGEDTVYNYPEVIRAVGGTERMCPRERWAQSPSPQQ